MTRLPTLYKCRGVPVKSPICAICLDRTRGRTQVRELTHGVKLSLCDGHHSVAFLRSNAGRDFAATLTSILCGDAYWQSSRIAETCPLILPIHRDLDALREDASGAGKISI